MDDKSSSKPQLRAGPDPSPKLALGSGRPLSKAAIATEYASLGLSVAGTISAFISKQAVYAAAPISVSLFLSLLNRQRLNQQLDQQARLSAQQAQVLNQLEEGLEPLQGQVVELQVEVEAQAQTERERPDFTTQFTRQLDQARAATAAQIEQLQQALSGSASQAQLAKLQTEFSEQQVSLEQKLSQGQSVSEQVEAIQAEFQSYVQSHEAVHQGLGADATAQVETLRQRLAWLEQQLKPQVPAPEPEPVAELKPKLSPETPATPSPIATLFLNLGIDFGTRYTKVCFQNLSDSNSEIIPFQPKAQSLSDALLLSQIGILPDGQLLAGLSESQWQELPLQNLKVLDGLKMRLADLDLGKTDAGWRLEAFPELDEPEMVENLCAYYLSRVIKKSQAWVRDYRPRLVANEIIGWSANVGVPVAYCDEQQVSDRFKRVLTLAWLLSNEPQTQALTLQLLQEQMVGLRKQLNQAVNCHAVPEIGAESWSFLNSREAQEGYYLFFDIGDGTIDGCAFHYERQDGEPQVEFYHGEVRPLGVRALSQALAAELDISGDAIAALFQHQPQDDKLVRSAKRKEAQQMIAKVVMKGGKAYGIHHPSAKADTYERKLTIFLGGGGSQLPFFQQLPVQTYQDFSHCNFGIAGYDVRLLPAPSQLKRNGLAAQDFHRFAVAFGLATDYANLSPALHLPKQVAENAPVAYASQSISGDVTPSEDSKDAY